MTEDTLLRALQPYFREDTTTSKEEWEIEDSIYDVLLVIVATVIIIANLMVITGLLFMVVQKKSHLTIHQRNSYILIFNLACADLLVGLASLSVFCVYAVNPKLVRTTKRCLLEICCTVTPCTASVFSITTISVDRYLSIMHPLRYDYAVKKWKVLFVVGTIWTVSLLLGFAPLMGWRNSDMDSSLHTCSILLILPTSYAIFLFIGIFFPQVFVMIYIYAKIFKVSRKHSKQISKVNRKRERDIPKNLSYEVDRRQATLERKEILTTRSCPVSPVMPRINTEYADPGPAFFPPRAVRFSLGPGDEDTLDRKRKHSMPAISLFRGGAKAACGRKTPTLRVGCVTDRHHELLSPPDDKPKPQASKSAATNKVHTLKRSLSYSSGLSVHSLATQIRTRFHNATHPSQSTKSSLKALRTIVLIIGFFFVMWSPFLVTSCVQLICGDSCHLYEAAGTYLLLLGYCNSAINPIVYSYTNKELKKQLCAPCVKRAQRKVLAKSSTDGPRSTADISDSRYGISSLARSNSLTRRASPSTHNGCSYRAETNHQTLSEFLSDDRAAKNCHLPNICAH